MRTRQSSNVHKYALQVFFVEQDDAPNSDELSDDRRLDDEFAALSHAHGLDEDLPSVAQRAQSSTGLR